jgi:hypothetical protein
LKDLRRGESLPPGGLITLASGETRLLEVELPDQTSSFQGERYSRRR